MDPFLQHRALPADPLPPMPPRTPEPQEERSSTPPQPEPPRIRIKRRRPGFNPHDQPLQPAMVERIPSIELSESMPLHALPHFHHPNDDSMLSPIYPSSSASLPPSRAATPPRTPVSKGPRGFFDNIDWYGRHRTSESADITRPSSAFSQLSDSSSSYSSLSSSDTFTSITDSCFTPDSERKDSLGMDRNLVSLASPVRLKAAVAPKRASDKPRKHTEARWTPEMEEHLWLTYMHYMSDPTVTPFKTLPGVAPPIGVCHRVAHAARKTWRSRRARLNTVMEDGTTPFLSLDGTVMRREASAPPVLPGTEESQVPVLLLQWPKESATRKRLRELCKRKPSLSPHYQRLMRSRSPSPFESSSRRVSSTPNMPSSSAFSTRDLNINLTTSTATSMQPSGPLAQLASSSSPISASDRTPQRTNVHQKSQSLEHDFDFGPSADMPMPDRHDSRRLASPFHELRHNATSSPQPSSASPMQANMASKPHSPLELHHPRPLSNSMKRRAQYPLGEEYLTADPSARAEFLQNLFKDPEAAAGKRRVRSRGFSLGAMRHGQPPARHISNLFTPPSTEDGSGAEASSAAAAAANVPKPQSRPFLPPIITTTNPLGQTGLEPPPSMPVFQGAGTTGLASHAPRLGSPFSPTFGMSNTFPRNLFPLGLDSMAGVESTGTRPLSSNGRQPSDPMQEGNMPEDPFGPAPANASTDRHSQQQEQQRVQTPRAASRPALAEAFAAQTPSYAPRSPAL